MMERLLTLDRLEEVTSSNQTSVGTVVALGSESHGSTVTATSLGLLVVGTAAVPCKTDQDGAVAAIIIIGVETLGDVVVDLLVIGLGGNKGLGGGRGTRGEVPDTETTSGGSSTKVQERGG